jgi:prepilin signal peptidase PulO-like enzyme (type II secretory pathway)
METILVSLLGIFVGGLVNWLADKIPYEPFQKPLHYRDGSARPISAWLGITAFVLGQRYPKEKQDTTPLSWRYPIVEIATAILMGLTLNFLQQQGATNPIQILIYIIYMPLLVLIFVVDLEHKLIMFIVMIPAILLALLDGFLSSEAGLSGMLSPIFRDSLQGAGLGFVVFYLLYLGGFGFNAIMGAIRGQRINTVAFGFGDVMLITFCGAILGTIHIILTIFISVFLGAFGAIAYLVIRAVVMRGGYKFFTALPYGPYIIIATVIMMLYGQQMQLMLLGY